MDELAKLMDELSIAIKARVDASKKTETLVKEVQGLPKLSVISPDDLSGSHKEENEELLNKMQLQLQLQNLNHTKSLGLETIEQAMNVVAQIRWSVNVLFAQSESSREQLVEDYLSQIEHEKTMYMAVNMQKQEIIFDLMKSLSVLEKLKIEADKLIEQSQEGPSHPAV